MRVTVDVLDEERSDVTPASMPPIVIGLENEEPVAFWLLLVLSSALAMVAPANTSPPAIAAVPRDRLIQVCMVEPFVSGVSSLVPARGPARKEH
ncbi:hypothetical protein [Terrabacter sp. NPDC000476]|uniref:hypothetical protein n=1 Tax=Terrabacter sp. NPDC000476 TaxID=3154258 RepID=UPI003326759A